MWYGCGSVTTERAAALRYAQGMAAKGTSVKELTESENDGDEEMFWMLVGDSDAYAKGDYWKWRSSVVPSEPRCWLVDFANSENPVSVRRCGDYHPLTQLLDQSSSDRVRRECATRIGVHN